ncbi:MAG TPA: hypothetical protein VGO86_13270 [Candidatus Dormibacteraeota bacterium]|jgi:hypothetical protein
MPYRYHGRDDQARAIAQARHWLDRLAQLTQFETVVLGAHGDDRDGRRAHGSTRVFQQASRAQDQG